MNCDRSCHGCGGLGRLWVPGDPSAEHGSELLLSSIMVALRERFSALREGGRFGSCLTLA